MAFMALMALMALMDLMAVMPSMHCLLASGCGLGKGLGASEFRDEVFEFSSGFWGLRVEGFRLRVQSQYVELGAGHL